MSWKTLIAAVVVASGASSVAIADGYQYEPVGKGFAPAPEFSWSGVYGGVHGGYGWGDSDIEESQFFVPQIGPPFVAEFRSSHDVEGGLGGVHLGMNKQFGNFVIGSELRLSGAQIEGSTNDCLGGIAADPGDIFVCNAEVQWMATALARLGYAHNRWLVYGTLGWAVAGIEYDSVFIGGPDGSSTPQGAANDTSSGIAFGGGVEYGFSNGVSLGVDYTRMNLESGRADTIWRLFSPDFISGERDIDLNTVTARLNFKWGGGK